MRKSILYVAGLLAVLSCTVTPNRTQEGEAGPVSVWLTARDKKTLFENVSSRTFNSGAETQTVITVDTAKKYQTIDGFGYALTGGSAWLMHEKLDSASRGALIRELFATDGKNIGISYLRVSVGASDLDDHVFSYAEKKDPSLAGFTLDEDRKHLIPVLKEILGIAPDMKIMASPWSAPAWMKDNNHAKGGSLKKEYYGAYAKYFVKYIQGMKDEGIRIDAITLQNEPENPNNTPSMLMTAAEQADFVANHLGPAFAAEGIDTKIVVFDHNCDHPEYPITILNDTTARKFIDGSAFHLYIGEVTALSKVRDAHPDKAIYFTEQWTSGEGDFGGDLGWHTKNLVIGATRNWSRNVLEWNLAADPQFNPHTGDGGCTLCQGALTIGKDVTRNVSYYIIAHASKFVRPGSVRIESNMIDGIPNVAFKTPDGQKVLVAHNESGSEKQFDVQSGNRIFSATLPAGAVGTFVW